MNPFGLLLISVGLLIIVIGFKGSQHNVMNAFKGIHGGSAAGKNSGKSSTPPSSGNTVGGGPGGTSMGVA